MGVQKNCCNDSIEPIHTSFPSTLTIAHHEQKIKIKSLLYKMIWELGFSCLVPPPRSSDQKGGGKGSGNNNLEHNKAWLLAESGGFCDAEPHSVHSSFRFSFCSQVEIESMSVNKCSSATVLMVNLDNGLIDSRSNELNWRRIESLERSISPVAHRLIRFTYNEIVAATRNFSKGRVLGRGALSYVFRGRVGLFRTSVAIKKLDKDDKESSKAFCRELMIASSLHNPHIVPLIGFCIDPEEGFFLIYKYVSGGSLEKYLHEKKWGAKGSAALSWTVRYKVAVGIADSLGYLHNGNDKCVVHRDIKPSNILLSSKKMPKLCDFGLASWTPAPSMPFICKTVKGTFGYLAPEYFQHGKVSDKTDVYAFGVVLLELITGRKPIETKRGPGEENLVSWAKPHLQSGAFDKLVDPRLKFPFRKSKQVAWMIQAASACITVEETRRPSINEVIAILKGKEPKITSKRKSLYPGQSGRLECYPQLQQSRSEIKSHLALAMSGLSEYEDEDHLYCR